MINSHPFVRDMAALIVARTGNGDAVTEADLLAAYTRPEVDAHFDDAKALARSQMTRRLRQSHRAA